ncbi:DNA-binding response regulator, NarL/FixJ family, contains REC and HTH domains [Actinobaculum suis]|uniref:DNA-binding response regulator, NarL/FixJ family, contains REC and HTH domains n=1 Tax=Actinobaculum suis TaxID=1657 RepID=A0A1B9BE47_9ACTO|nr:response regulator transcription factor [Actinobaculum suis]MDY5152732.1 response regulator transcription factor [Actinobaculum suis]OCA95762.1 DNA-binding response regulator [Actinobaculum suis]SDE08599.1 DNA-binding response regulator, NarL/FixJ family, contains REC and HTH domains [Actinobaculum suis]VDG75308.1 two-component response regulator YfiJ [Actinobaculum suis]
MKVIVADDSALFREGLVGILERRKHEVCAQVASAPELLATVAETPVDVIITDVRMPPNMTDDGLRAAVEIRRAHPSIGIVVLSQYVAPAYARELFDPSGFRNAGGFGNTGGVATSGEEPTGGLAYLLKDRVARVADFMRSLDVVAAGGVVVDPEVAGELMRGSRSRLAEMTEREMEILALMAEGLSNSQMAEKLYLSGATISKHVASIFQKLGMEPGEENRRVRAVLAYLTDHGATR